MYLPHTYKTNLTSFHVVRSLKSTSFCSISISPMSGICQLSKVSLFGFAGVQTKSTKHKSQFKLVKVIDVYTEPHKI